MTPSILVAGSAWVFAKSDSFRRLFPAFHLRACSHRPWATMSSPISTIFLPTVSLSQRPLLSHLTPALYLPPFPILLPFYILRFRLPHCPRLLSLTQTSQPLSRSRRLSICHLNSPPLSVFLSLAASAPTTLDRSRHPSCSSVTLHRQQLSTLFLLPPSLPISLLLCQLLARSTSDLISSTISSTSISSLLSTPPTHLLSSSPAP